MESAEDPKRSPILSEEKGVIDSQEVFVDDAIDPIAEKKLLRKLDLNIIPPLVILFVIAFVDRVNIGNAKIQGLTTDLQMEGNNYNIVLFIFFIPYILCEVPSNLVLKHVAPSTWLCGIMFCWGIITICEGCVQSYGGLVALRFLLGIFEAGFSPGSVYLISMYYKRYELQWRLSLFFFGSIIASAFGGLFAYALLHMDGIGGYAGWRWIFIIEGLLTCVVAAVFKFIVVDWPETSKFLTADERALLFRRLNEEYGSPRMDRLDKSSAKRIYTDWKIYVATLMYLGVVNTGNASTFFIPTIINQMGYSAASAQVMSIPIWTAAAIISLVVAWATDRLQHRFAFTLLGVVVAAVGYILFLCMDSVSIGVRYFACFLIVIGAFITQPVAWAWLANNVSGHYKRGVAAAVQIGFGNLGGITASNIYITTQAPKYPAGFGVSLGMLVMCGIMCTVFYFGLKAENHKRDRGGRDYRFQEGESELANMGDDHPDFRFTL